MDFFNVVEAVDKKFDTSYAQNNYGMLLYSLVRVLKPQKCVDFGINEGYSTFCIASALKDNDSNGYLDGYDLFEDYKYKSSTKDKVEEKLNMMNVDEFVTLHHIDIFDAILKLEDNSIDFIHLDISNDGEKLERFIAAGGANKIKNNGLLVFEGGSFERDKVDWMKKHNKKSLRTIFENKIFKRHFDHVVLSPFPSITICEKK